MRFITALVNTFIILMIIPTIGLILGAIQRAIAKTLARHIGSGAAFIILNVFTFFGVMHHELSHALYALITGAKVEKVELFKPNESSLGRVFMTPRGPLVLRSIQSCMSAIAPTVQGLITECILIKYFPTNNIVLTIIFLYIMISIFIHMTMSIQDIICELKGLPICALIIFLICFITDFSIVSIIASRPVDTINIFG